VFSSHLSLVRCRYWQIAAEIITTVDDVKNYGRNGSKEPPIDQSSGWGDMNAPGKSVAEVG
jgi:hypothetical protein